MNRLFAISDIHGCFDTFYELVVRVIDLKKSDRLILLGDYIDRGWQSREVVDFIIDLLKKGFDVIPLRGNHEQMLLDSRDDPMAFPLWQMNSGDTTLISFGIGEIREADKKYIDFFSDLDFYFETDKYIFVHAGFNDYLTDPFSDRHTMIWECSPSYTNARLQGKMIIHGHRPKTIDFVKKLIREKSVVIPIDTGCVYDKEMGYGNLSALELNAMALISVPNYQNAL